MTPVILVLALLILPIGGEASEQNVDASLLEAFDRSGDTELLSINIILKEQAAQHGIAASTEGLSREAGREHVESVLRSISTRTQAGIVSYLRLMEMSGQAADISALWIVNAVNAKVTRAVLDRLCRNEEVAWIGYNKEVYALSGLSGDARLPLLRRRVSDDVARRGEDPASAPPDTSWGVKWINAPAAWKMGYRGKGALVAILDTGIWYSHSDLVGRIWTNKGEIPGDGIDNDGNGYVDDYHGFDFNADDPDPTENGIGHGTHVAGTVAGDGTGGTITGVAPEAKLMGCKVLDDNGYGYEWDAWEGIQYAIDNGAQILQGSIGWIHELHAPNRSAWRYLSTNVLAAGSIMSFAGGNERGWYAPPDDIRTPGDCPSPWRHPDQALAGGVGAVVTVGATDYLSDSCAWFSSTGPTSWYSVVPYYDYPFDPQMGLTKPDICAPGNGINSTIIGGGYSGDRLNGTSMAAPHNSGLIALMLSKNLVLTPALIDSILQSTALDLGTAGKDNDYGSGLIQADAALLAVPELKGVSIRMTSADSLITAGSDLFVDVTFTNSLSTPLTFDFWAVAATPGSGVVQILSPLLQSIDGYETSETVVTITIPGDVPSGSYGIVGLAGGHPTQIMDRNGFFVTVEPPNPWEIDGT